MLRTQSLISQAITELIASVPPQSEVYACATVDRGAEDSADSPPRERLAWALAHWLVVMNSKVRPAAGSSAAGAEGSPQEQGRPLLELHRARLAAETAAAAADPQQAAALSLRTARALASRACGNPRCTDLGGGSEAELRARKGKVCSGCRALRFCCAACQRAAWAGGHRAACRLLAAEAVKA